MNDTMTDSEKLRLLAAWFDKEQSSGRQTWSKSIEVQKDLLRIADLLETS